MNAPQIPAADAEAQASLERLQAEGNDPRELMRRIDAMLAEGDASVIEHARQMLSDVLALQVHDASARTHGQFPMRLNRTPGDLNSCVFMLPLLIDVHRAHGERLGDELADRLDRAIDAALVAAQRRWDEEVFDVHRDHKAYTNIFLLYIQGLLLGGRHTGDERLRRVAMGQWQRWFSHVAYLGIDEFVSAGNYGDIDYRVLRRLHAETDDPQMRRQVELVLDYLVTLEHAITHPRLELAVCGSSRDYRRFLRSGSRAPASVRGDDGRLAGDYQPPQDVVREYRERRFPVTVTGRATGVPFIYRSWQSECAALGSMTGGNYFWQQIHCMVAVGRDADQREVLVLPGSYTIANGYVSHHQNRALCLHARRPNTYLRTQGFLPDDAHADAFGELGMAVSDGWQVREADHRLILSAYDHTVAIDPFVIVADHVQPLRLKPTRRDTLSQGRFHETATDMLEYVYPDDPHGATWLGCVVQLAASADPPSPTPLSWERGDRRVRLHEPGGLRVSLFEQPSGELTQLHETDWRTMPLLTGPVRTLWPGELAAEAVNQQQRPS